MGFPQHLQEILACGLAYLLAFFLPGYFVSRWLRSPAPVLSAFLISLMILCQGFFWLEVGGIPVRFWNMFAWETGWSALGAVACAAGRRQTIPLPRNPPHQISSLGWILIVPATITGAILLLRAWLVPLTGPDLPTRWDLLAREVLRYGHYHFYPPRSADDFRYYGFLESLPPMLTAALWWIYAAMGRAIPQATAGFILLQYIVLAGWMYRLARRMASPLAGALAVMLLASAPLTFFSLVMGEETGLLAIAAVALLYFLYCADDHSWRNAALAGAAAALAGLTREYGLIYPLLGLILALWLRRPMRWIAVFAATTALLAAPWYLRTWILTGNPVYSVASFGIFPVNPLIYGLYRVAGRTHPAWPAMLFMAFKMAPLHGLLALPVLAVALWKRRAVLVAAFLVLFGIWFRSMKMSDATLYWARTLLPALAVLCILIAVCALPLLRRVPIICLIVLLSACSFTTAYGLIYPRGLEATPPRLWLAAALSTDSPDWTASAREAHFGQYLPSGCRVLSTDIYAAAQQLDTPNPVVPLWSPEVSFIFDPALSLSEVYRRLEMLHICAVWFTRPDLNRYPFNHLYADGPTTWKPLVTGGEFTLFRLPQTSRVH